MSSRTHRRSLAPLSALLIAAGAAHAQTDQSATFRGLGFIGDNGQASAALALSSNGMYASGWCDNDAVRWSESGTDSLGRLDAPFNGLAAAYAISADGMTVVGYGRAAAFGSPFRAFIWRDGLGMAPIGDPPGPGSIFGSYASGVSADGTVIVGASDAETGYPRAFCLSPKRSWSTICNFPSSASGVSADGQTVVGVASVKGIDIPFAWSDAKGLRFLGDLKGGMTGGVAYAVNADASVIVGGSMSSRSDPKYAYEAFRWTAWNGMQPLGDLPTGDFSSEARAVSADGSVVVGLSGVFPSPRTAAFIWTETDGMRDLRDVLVADYNLDLTGWELSSAQAISADGRTIVGRGVNPQGAYEGWIAYLGRRCAADFNGDGALNSSDFIAFIDAFLCPDGDPMCPGADFNADGVENSADFFDFIIAFFTGCPN
jgi:probable HAF family extracellular repeat protein